MIRRLSALARAQIPKSTKTEAAPTFRPIHKDSVEQKKKQVEDPLVTDITKTNYRLFHNPIFKNAATDNYNFSNNETKELIEAEEIKVIDSIENITSLPDYKLVIVMDNLISREAQKHYLNVLSTNGLFNKYYIALHESKKPRHNSTIPIHDGTFDAPYDAGGGRRNKKRSTKHKKRRGKKTRKYRSK
jgi:hypothetical protein